MAFASLANSGLPMSTPAASVIPHPAGAFQLNSQVLSPLEVPSSSSKLSRSACS